MADPLSVAASIIGILAAAGKVAETLGPIISSLRDTEHIAATIYAEVNSARTILFALQALFLDLEQAPISRRQLIQLDQLIATLTDGVLIFNELEPLVLQLSASTDNWRSRVQWTRKKGTLSSHVSRMQHFKGSISLMLSILQCESDLEARKKHHELYALTSSLMERLSLLEIRTRPTSQFDFDDSGSTTSVVTVTAKTWARDFEKILEGSWVYRRIRRTDCDVSFRSSIALSHALTAFSEFSLSDISNISVVALPLVSADLVNGYYYQSTAQQYTPLSHAKPAADVVRNWMAQDDSESGVGMNFLSPVDEMDEDPEKRCDPVYHLPAEITTMILSNLDGSSLINAKLVSKSWLEAASSNHVWKHVFLRKPEPRTLAENVEAGQSSSLSEIPSIAMAEAFMNFKVDLFDVFDLPGMHITRQQLEAKLEYSYLGDDRRFLIEEKECVITVQSGKLDKLRKDFSLASHGIVIAYSVHSRRSFDTVAPLLRLILRLKDTSSFPVLIVGVEDHRTQTPRQVSSASGQALALQFGFSFVEVSSDNEKDMEWAAFTIVKEIWDYQWRYRRDRTPRLPLPESVSPVDTSCMRDNSSSDADSDISLLDLCSSYELPSRHSTPPTDDVSPISLSMSSETRLSQLSLVEKTSYTPDLAEVDTLPQTSSKLELDISPETLGEYESTSQQMETDKEREGDKLWIPIRRPDGVFYLNTVTGTRIPHNEASAPCLDLIFSGRTVPNGAF